jgi:hypothetical protein
LNEVKKDSKTFVPMVTETGKYFDDDSDSGSDDE